MFEVLPKTSVRHFRACTPRNGPLDWPRKARDFLAAADFDATLSPEAILCVRQFSTALPRSAGGCAASTVAMGEWEQRINERLREMLRRAVRPALEPTGSDAQAVWFADMAELLASLAIAAGSGCIAHEWWWRVLFPDAAPLDISTIWLRFPTHVPAALQALAAREQLAVLVRSLDSCSVVELCRAIATVFRVEAIERVVAAPFKQTSDAREILGPVTTTKTIPAPVRDLSAQTHLALHDTIARIVPERTSMTAAPETLAFVTWALLLYRAPAIVRQPSFASRFASWSRAPDQPPLSIRTDKSPSRGPASRGIQIQPRADQQQETAAHLSASATQQHSGGDKNIILPDETAEFHSVENLVPSPSRVFVLKTEFGGLLYLINAAIHFGWYGDFAAPRRESPLSIWDFIALLGERAFAHELRGDPLWSALADLAGRGPTDRPGTDFSDFNWLSTTNASPLPPNTEPISNLGDWIEWHASFLEARLQRALGTESPRATWDSLCRAPARLACTGTHVEARFALANHPIEIRIAGLDRDPAWIPSAGRHIRFVYD